MKTPINVSVNVQRIVKTLSNMKNLNDPGLK